jgi:hypothetical protein
MLNLRKTVAKHGALRRVVVPVYRLYARAHRFSPGSRVLVNSMPKAGTHLVTSLLEQFPDLMFSGRHHSFRHFAPPDAPPPDQETELRVDWRRLERALASVNRGQWMTGHFSAEPRLLALLNQLDYKIVSIIRDPRDVAVSSVYYFSGLKRHYLYEDFNTNLKTMDERLMAVIEGLPATSTRRGLGDIAHRIRRYALWLENPSTYGCRFEQLVGARGGGTLAKQREEIRRLGNHIDRPLSDDEIDVVASKTWSTRVSTFRKGRIGDWRNHFSDEHIAAFKEIAGDQLIALGYEQDNDW